MKKKPAFKLPTAREYKRLEKLVDATVKKFSSPRSHNHPSAGGSIIPKSGDVDRV